MPPLTESGQADVVIVGGGFCGLSTALHLAERGIRPVVLEAREVGFGGSGRNGGQVIPGSEIRSRRPRRQVRARVRRAARALCRKHRRHGLRPDRPAQDGRAAPTRRLDPGRAYRGRARRGRAPGGAMGGARGADPGARQVRDRAASRNGAIPRWLARRPRRCGPAAELRPRPRPCGAEGRCRHPRRQPRHRPVPQRIDLDRHDRSGRAALDRAGRPCAPTAIRVGCGPGWRRP